MREREGNTETERQRQREREGLRVKSRAPKWSLVPGESPTITTTTTTTTEPLVMGRPQSPAPGPKSGCDAMESRGGSAVLGLGQRVPPFGDLQLQEEEEASQVFPWRRNSGGSHEEEKVASSSSSGVIAGGGGGGRFASEPSEEEEEEEEEALLELRRRRGRSLSLPSSPDLAAAARVFPDRAEEGEAASSSSSSPSVVGCCTKCKKRVQFADSLGLCLASVKHFSAAEEPQVPPAVLSRLQSFPMRRKDLEEFSAVLAELSGGCPGFLLPRREGPSTTTAAPSTQRAPLRLEPRPEEEGEEGAMVSLEEVSGTAVSGSPCDVRGVVRVQKCPGPKEVTVRYTFNEWLSFLDADAILDSDSDKALSSSSSSSSERYRFCLCLPPGLDEGTAVHFAICYRSQQGEFWDNNRGANYTLRGGGGGGGGGKSAQEGPQASQD